MDDVDREWKIEFFPLNTSYTPSRTEFIQALSREDAERQGFEMFVKELKQWPEGYISGTPVARGVGNQANN